MITQLVYASARKPNCTSGEIEKIVQSCKKNNGPMNVTGVLLYSKSHFVQYLEGNYKTIFGLYDKIKTDDRHGNVVLISTGVVEDRLFPSWQMGSKYFNTEEVSFNSDITVAEAKLFNDILMGNGPNNTKTIGIIKKIFK